MFDYNCCDHCGHQYPSVGTHKKPCKTQGCAGGMNQVEFIVAFRKALKTKTPDELEEIKKAIKYAPLSPFWFIP